VSRLFESCYGPMIDHFLKYKETLGYSRSTYEGFLADFDKYCALNYPQETVLNKEIALNWGIRRKTEQQSGYRRRLSTLREFGKFLDAISDHAYIIPSGLAGSSPQYTPYIFTDEELTKLFEAADRLEMNKQSPNRHIVLPVLLRLIYFCGLRPNEGRELKTADVDLENGILLIRGNKTHKERLVPMSDDMLNLCRKYSDNLLYGNEYFFQNQDGNLYSAKWLTRQFLKVWSIATAGSEHHPRVRVYDLRHRFATAVMMKWIEDGIDLYSKLPYLRAYMGHSEFSATAYYIHLLPERLTKTNAINWEHFSDMIPGVSSWEL
jgi:integrase/recombinase XerD